MGALLLKPWSHPLHGIHPLREGDGLGQGDGRRLERRARLATRSSLNGALPVIFSVRTLVCSSARTRSAACAITKTSSCSTTIPCGTRMRSSTNCTSARFMTVMGTGLGTFEGSPRSSTICKTWASPPSGFSPSVRRRYVMMAMILPTTAISIRTTGACVTSETSYGKRTGVDCASSPNWW